LLIVLGKAPDRYGTPFLDDAAPAGHDSRRFNTSATIFCHKVPLTVVGTIFFIESIWDRA
jgi:hypothetical protein